MRPKTNSNLFQYSSQKIIINKCMNDNSNTSDSIEQIDKNRSKTDIEEIRPILLKISQMDSTVKSSLPQSIKNQKADVTQSFFMLIDNFSDFFEKSVLPRNQSRLLFAYFLSLHHFAIDLYCPGISHTDAEFTSLWKNFSWIFKMLQPYIFPSDYNHVIEQINQEYVPLRTRYEGKPNTDEFVRLITKINSALEEFNYSVGDLQDPYTSSENFSSVLKEFAKLKQLFRIFCQKINLTPPHLFNALSLAESILTYGKLFVSIRDTIKEIDNKVQESSIISIHIPLEMKDPYVHRQFLNSSVKIHQVENRLIYDKIIEIYSVNLVQNSSQDVNTTIANKFFLSTTLLLDFSSVLAIHLDSQLVDRWQSYVTTSDSYFCLIDQPKLILQKISSQVRPQSQQIININKSRNNEQINLMNLKNEISFSNQNPAIFSYYEEFIRLYGFIANDQSPRSIHPLSHCIILLLKISNETNNDVIKNASSKLIDNIVSHLIVAKTHEDLVHLKYVIKKIIDQKKRKEQLQYIKQQLGSSNSISILNSDSNTKSNANANQYLTYNSKTNDSPYQVLVALCYHTRDIISSLSNDNDDSRIQSHQREYLILKSYSYYLDLLVAVSAPKLNSNNNEGSIPLEYLKYHMNPDQIVECLKVFFGDIINERLPFTATVPPVIFSSSLTRNGKLDPADMQRLASLLLTERCKEYDAQYIIMEYKKMILYVDQISKFLEYCNTSVVFEPKLNIDVFGNNKLMSFVTDLIKLREKPTFSIEESREMAEAIFPLLLKAMYKRAIMKVKIDEIVFKIIKTLYVPRCPDLIQKCYLIMDPFDSLSAKNPSLRTHVSVLKLLITAAFTGSSDFHKYIQISNIKESIEKIDNEIKMKSDQANYEETKNCLDSFKKFMVLCKLLDWISENFKEYKIGKYGNSKPGQPESQDQEKNDEQQPAKLEVIIDRASNDTINDNNNKQIVYNEETGETANNDDETNQDDDVLEIVNPNKNENEDESNDPYKIPYVSILTKVNHIALMRQKLIDGKKLNLFISINSDNSLDLFCESLIKEINDVLSTNKFYYIIESKLDAIIKKFTKQFDFAALLKNLIQYFEELAVYLMNINEMSAIQKLVSDKKLKVIKNHLTEAVNNISDAPERISNTVLTAKELSANTNTMEGFMVHFMTQNYIDRAQNVLNLFLLRRYPVSFELSSIQSSVVAPMMIANPVNLAVPQQSQSAVSQFPFQQFIIAQKPQQSQSQPKVSLLQQYQQLPKFQQIMQQMQQIPQLQQIPAKIQIIQNPGKNYQIVIPSRMSPAQQAVYPFQPAQSQVMTHAASNPQNFAIQKLYQIIKILEKFPSSPAVTSTIEKCKDMCRNTFQHCYGILASISPEKASDLQLVELKAIKNNLKTNICKLETANNDNDNSFASNDEHFERCLRMVDNQMHKKDEKIRQLNETIENIEEELREMEKKMTREETASPEIISALDSILDDDLLSNIVGPANGTTVDNSAKSMASSADLNINNGNANNLQSGSRRRGRHRGRYSAHTDDINTNKDDQKEEQSSGETSANLSASSSSSSIEKVKSIPKKQKSASIINSLLLQVKNAEILNQRLRRKVEKLRFPSATPPLSSDKFTNAYPLYLDNYEGCSWIASNVKESYSSRNELSKLQEERDNLFEQIVRANASKSEPLKPEYIENLYGNVISACSNVGSSSTINGKVSKSIFLSFIEKSDSLFTYLDYDINTIKKKLKLLGKQNRMTPSEFVSQFAKKLQILE